MRAERTGMQSLPHRTVSTRARQYSHRRSAPATIRELPGAPTAGAASAGVEPHPASLFRVLAIDGGGVRGVIQARTPTALDDAARRPIAEIVDLIIGASIGGIAASDALTDCPIYFRPKGAASLAGCDMPTAAVARAATAAPTFFPPLGRQVGGKAHGAAGAGVHARDVSLLAYTEERTHAAVRGRSSDDIFLALLRSGRQYGSRDCEIDDIVRRHGAGLADRLMKAAEIRYRDTRRRLLGDVLQCRCWRFRPPLFDGSGFVRYRRSSRRPPRSSCRNHRPVHRDRANESGQLAEQLVLDDGGSDLMSRPVQ